MEGITLAAEVMEATYYFSQHTHTKPLLMRNLSSKHVKGF